MNDIFRTDIDYCCPFTDGNRNGLNPIIKLSYFFDSSKPLDTDGNVLQMTVGKRIRIIEEPVCGVQIGNLFVNDTTYSGYSGNCYKYLQIDEIITEFQDNTDLLSDYNIDELIDIAVLCYKKKKEGIDYITVEKGGTSYQIETHTIG